MKQFVVAAFALGLLVNISGCGSVKGESEMKEFLKLQKEAKAAIEKDPTKVKEYLPKMMEAGQKLEALKLTEDEQKKLYEKFKPDLEAMGVKSFEEFKKNK